MRSKKSALSVSAKTRASPSLRPSSSRASTIELPTPRRAVDGARRSVALLLNTTARRIVFTGGGSEANNLAVKGAALGASRGGHVVTTAVEHPSVLKTCRWLETRGYELTCLRPDGEGRVLHATWGVPTVSDLRRLRRGGSRQNGE